MKTQLLDFIKTNKILSVILCLLILKPTIDVFLIFTLTTHNTLLSIAAGLFVLTLMLKLITELIKYDSQKKRRTSFMKKIFISLPTKNLTEDEIKATRTKAIQSLTAFMLGEPFEIINNSISYVTSDEKPLHLLAKQLELLSVADYALFVSNWDTDFYCRIENMCAQEHAIQTIYFQ